MPHSHASSPAVAPPKGGIAVWCRRLALSIGMMAGVSTMVGCFIPIYSARPERRVQQLLYTSEDMRSLLDTWERFWFLDSPSHMTPIRTHGGIM
ncbi:MAG: hypothetical protein AAGJ40_06580 [Planctomycetota bacterium]